MSDVFGKTIKVTENTKAGAFLDKTKGEGTKGEAKDIEETFKFGFVAFPVFGGKGPKGDVGDTHLCTFFDEWLDGIFGGIFVTFDRFQPAGFSPAAVAVHNDGYMLKR